MSDPALPTPLPAVPPQPPQPPQPVLPFALYEGLDAQRDRVERLRATEPSAADAMMRLGSAMVTLATAGNVAGLSELVAATPQHCILYWFTKKMFQSACGHGRVNVVRWVDGGSEWGFMLRTGHTRSPRQCERGVHGGDLLRVTDPVHDRQWLGCEAEDLQGVVSRHHGQQHRRGDDRYH